MAVGQVVTTALEDQNLLHDHSPVTTTFLHYLAINKCSFSLKSL